MARLSEVIVAATLLMLVLSSCSSDEDSTVPTERKNHTPETSITIKIGNITDKTGPAANAMETVDLALEDAMKYWDEKIPGVKLKVIHYDGQMDPSKTIAGYEWLKNQGADVFTTSCPGVAPILKPKVEDEKNVLFSLVGEHPAIEPPGHVFCLGSVPDAEAYTLLSWIAANDWDYEAYGPAKIGAAAWGDNYATDFVQAMQKYAQAHPDQFDFAGEYLTNFGIFDWSAEAESLKRCDYIFPPIILTGFPKNLRSSGSQARLIGGSPHTGFFTLLDDANAWPLVDGMLIIYTGGYWGQDDKLIILQEKIMRDYHPDNVEELQRSSGYGALGPYLMLGDIIAKTVDVTGPEGFNSEALHDTAQSWYYPMDERPKGYSFSSTKRYMINDLCVQELSAEQKTLVRNDPNWYPIMTEP